MTSDSRSRKIVTRLSNSYVKKTLSLPSKWTLINASYHGGSRSVLVAEDVQVSTQKTYPVFQFFSFPKISPQILSNILYLKVFSYIYTYLSRRAGRSILSVEQV